MTTLHIEDNVAATLLAQARARGLSLERYLQLLADFQAPPTEGTGNPAESVQDFDLAMEELFAADTRTLSPDSTTHSREDIYNDHD